jgi:nitrite reductase/ring-hydroxylating ferredoxin subunit
MPDAAKTARKEQDPLWRDEFSISKADERYVSRRQLAKFLTLASLGMFAGNSWILIKIWLRKTPVYSRSLVARVGEIPVGGVKLFQYPKPGEQCIMIRTSDDVYVAYSQKCTHLSCAVFYAAAENRIECPCHQGYFSVRDGSVLQGPPTRPLPRVVLERSGDELIAIRMEPGV